MQHLSFRCLLPVVAAVAAPLSVAFAATRPLFAVAPLAAPDAAPAPVATLIILQPTASVGAPASVAAADGAAELTPLPPAPVVADGSLQIAPDPASAAVSAIVAGETVSLLGKSPDSAWLQVIDARGRTGWGQRALFQLDPTTEWRLPVVVP